MSLYAAHEATRSRGGLNRRSVQEVIAPDDLTDREHQVLELVAQGMTNEEIGKELFLSPDTVKTHLRRAFRKIGARDRANAVAIAFQKGIFRRVPMTNEQRSMLEEIQARVMTVRRLVGPEGVAAATWQRGYEECAAAVLRVLDAPSAPVGGVR